MIVKNNCVMTLNGGDEDGILKFGMKRIETGTLVLKSDVEGLMATAFKESMA